VSGGAAIGNCKQRKRSCEPAPGVATDGLNLQGEQQMGFTIYGFPSGSNSPDAGKRPSAATNESVLRLKWGIRANAETDGEPDNSSCGGSGTKAINQEAVKTRVSGVIAAVAEVALHYQLRAESPGGFTAPDALRSQSAYDLAPLILRPKET
jgi:hypothetical protein